MGVDFFRKPFRAVTYNPKVFYAPADGFVLYAKYFKADEFLEVKGKKFTLKELLCDDDYKTDSLVIGIFMSQLDVHWNRVPTDSFFVSDKERKTPNIFTNNSSMIDIEKALLNGEEYSENDMGYLHSNERKVSYIYSTALRHEYYIVQIADKDVDVIVNHAKGHFVLQGEEFGQIMWGSQVDLVIPLKKKKRYKILVKSYDHVEAGLDAVLEVL